MVLDKVKETIRKYSLLSPGDRVVAAVSGGPDSVCLLRILTLLAAEYRLQIIVAHMNHCLRGEESDRDERFVKQLAADLNLRCENIRIDIPALLKSGVSVEDLCRQERYKYLAGVCSKHDYMKVALGHNRDDQAETVLMNLLRGSGLEGLKGFSPLREGMWIRPLFEVTRREILGFLEAEKIGYIVDSSNETDRYLRNRLRRGLIPQIEKEYNPRVSEGLFRMSEIVALEDDYMKSAAEDVLRTVERNGREMRMDIRSLLSCHPALQRRIVKSLLLELTPEDKGISYPHVLAVLDLAKGGSPGGRLDLPHGIRVGREYVFLFFTEAESGKRGKCAIETNRFSHPVEIPGVTDVHSLGLRIRFETIDVSTGGALTDTLKNDPGHIFLDYDKLNLPLSVRSIDPGDRIRLVGIPGRKKISDVLIDAKVPRHRRAFLPLLVDREEVLWMIGMKGSGKARITAGTRKILKAEII